MAVADRSAYIINILLFRQCAYKFRRFIDNYFGNAANAIAARKVGEFCSFDHISRYSFTFNCHLMSQPRRGWAIRSAWCCKDFDIYILRERAEKFASLF